MTREDAKEYIVHNPQIYFKEAKKSGYICPLCNNGTGSSGDGVVVDRNDSTRTHYKCFKCGFYGDVIDFIGAEYALNDHRDKFEKAYSIYNLIVENGSCEDVPNKHESGRTENHIPEKRVVANYNDKITKDISELNNNPVAMKYLSERGLSRETIEKFRLGCYYDNYNVLRISIPYNSMSTYYIGRRIDNINDFKYVKPKSEEAGQEPLWNEAVLKNNNGQPIFIVEGVFCAMSIYQAGGQAIALNTTGEPNSFKRALDRLKTFGSIFIVCLDKDANEAGQNGQKRLVECLKNRNLKYIEYDLSDECKDPNELLQKDKERFNMNVGKAINKANSVLYGELEEDNYNYLLNTFQNDLEEFSRSRERKTGYSNLDELNGLYNGLYVIGAVSSLGKTTFTYQLGDQLASAGEKVIYFSLEQSRLEMLTKSISRITAQIDHDNAVSSLEIRKGHTAPIISQAIEKYKDTARNMHVVECNFNADIEYIKDFVARYIKHKKVKPVVIIDYLQIIPPVKAGENTKDTVDHNVRELKKLQRDNDLIIFVISSINRSNYLAPIDFESFKESGGIEYTADVVWGLQLEVLYSDLFKKDKRLIEKRDAVEKAKKEIPRKVVLKCLKNRYGISSYSCGFSYDPRYDLFIADTDFRPADATPFDETEDTTRSEEILRF